MKTPATAAALSGRAGRTMKIPATARAGESVRPSCAEQPQPPHSSGRTAQTKKTPATAAALGRTDWADHEDSSHSRRTQRAGWADHEDTSNSSGGRVRPPELRGTATAAALKRTDCETKKIPATAAALGRADRVEDLSARAQARLPSFRLKLSRHSHGRPSWNQATRDADMLEAGKHTRDWST